MRAIQVYTYRQKGVKKGVKKALKYPKNVYVKRETPKNDHILALFDPFLTPFLTPFWRYMLQHVDIHTTVSLCFSTLLNMYCQKGGRKKGSF